MFIFIDKEQGITSHDVVNKIRRITGKKRVGHAGTLDPNATGLLIVAVGREFTKKLWTVFGKLDKTYIAEIILGEEREGDDATGNLKLKVQNSKHISLKKVKETLNDFVGKQMQVPPEYSAVKVNGKEAYKFARSGRRPILKAREIEIISIKLLNYEYPLLKIECEVSSGTYIRALARDIGKKLGCGAYLNNLRRMRIGRYDVDSAICMDQMSVENLKLKSQYLR